MDALIEAATAHMKGDLETAETLYLQALEDNPENPDAWQMLAVLHLDRNIVTEAERCNARALELAPNSAAALNTQGNILKSEGRFEDAVEAYARALELAPDLPQALTNLGDTLRRLRRFDEARELCGKAADLAPDLAAAHNNLGAVLLDTEAPDDAAKCFESALAIAPQDTDTRINLARALARAGDPTGAGDQARLALQGGAGNAVQKNSLASVFLDIGEVETAKDLVESALAQQPDLADASNNLGNILVRLGALDEAINEFGAALEQCPDNPDYLANLGAARQAAGDIAAAEICFESAIKIDPGHADAHWNRGLARLLRGDLAGGFADYEWRWRLPEFTRRHRDIAAWTGDDPGGKTLLIHSEQGFGDTIQCVRYAATLSELGATVILETHAPLCRLMETADGVDRVVARGEPLPEIDLQAPILSLPHLLETTLETIPARFPYLRPRPEDSIDFGDFGGAVDLNLGFVWAGRPSHRNDRNRSSSPRLFRPLAEFAGVRLYSLQVGAATQHLKDADWAADITDLAPQLTDFSATAMAIAGLDLIVSVDTAVAHLAGALGKECWLLLPFAPDWRWLLARASTPWYPSLRLFRQETAGDWEAVMRRVVDALGERDSA
ncbi:MAG: tetratricopeptide repeat protein [Rhodospirillales bacterium]|nr:tetratricopeptide repeat protein [Rhodospirillales bacterium]MDP6644916.1 tetratricopeptide repeat protein [Rhodospirillales bacterium]MDP6841372.1 tetratricopeptide repeat protein [Rhodospirillales bacterium]